MGPIESKSARQTRRFGRLLGELLGPGDVIGLTGDLGAGKTEFTRGAAEGLNVDPSVVASPTFAIVYPYRGRIPLYHADFYRLSDFDELYATGVIDLLNNPDGASVVEWANKIADAMPAELMVIHFEVGATSSERRLLIQPKGARYQLLANEWIKRIRAHQKSKNEPRDRRRRRSPRTRAPGARHRRRRAPHSR